MCKTVCTGYWATTKKNLEYHPLPAANEMFGSGGELPREGMGLLGPVFSSFLSLSSSVDAQFLCGCSSLGLQPDTYDEWQQWPHPWHWSLNLSFSEISLSVTEETMEKTSPLVCSLFFPLHLTWKWLIKMKRFYLISTSWQLWQNCSPDLITFWFLTSFSILFSILQRKN